ncbi:DUF6514 family protein [Hydrogenoanaerobacterium sp.]|uniref:DUF6514 family protein n=1 Tax=Hydrogenoanaerobacterium sp. TaxID=2953763 RepID=UPI0028A19245|nr:DUF6514 family protein [Hydrogenoanaerobacterium sp.]
MYWLVSENLADENSSNYVSYGIATDGYYIGDISTRCENVERLLYLCNTHTLSKMHFTDVVEDWVAGL